MNTRYAFFYFMNDQIEKIGKTVPAHIDYWQNRQLDSYLGGPFSDKSGGLITFTAKDISEAESIMMNDPFIKEEVIANKCLKEWLAK